MNDDSNLLESYGQFVNPAYPEFLKRMGLDHAATAAQGACITDASGKTYIDCTSGYGIFNVGHNHPDVVRALTHQLTRNALFTKPLVSPVQVELAQKLAEISPGDLTCSFVCNSGSEAVDSAIKLARLSQSKKKIIAAQNGFHGYTFGALSASGIQAFKRFFEPLVPGIMHVPYGDLEALEQEMTPDTAAVLLEPVQHEAGVLMPPEGYLAAVRRLCDAAGVLFILDEIKTGFGRTGRMFACEHSEVVPDMLVVGKSLGGGLMPIGALMGKEALWGKFSRSFAMSASSFAGNVLACRAALATIDILGAEGFLDECRRKAEALLAGLRKTAMDFPECVHSVNGLGFLLGLEAPNPRKAFELSREMIRQGVIALQAFANGRCIMMEPPLVLSWEQMDQVVAALRKACEMIVHRRGAESAEEPL